MATSNRTPAALRSLATDAGIVLEYMDATGVERDADPEVLLAILNGLGVPIGRASGAARLLRSRRSARIERIVEPVTVLDDAVRRRGRRLPARGGHRSGMCDRIRRR